MTLPPRFVGEEVERQPARGSGGHVDRATLLDRAGRRLVMESPVEVINDPEAGQRPTGAVDELDLEGHLLPELGGQRPSDVDEDRILTGDRGAGSRRERSCHGKGGGHTDGRGTGQRLRHSSRQRNTDRGGDRDGAGRRGDGYTGGQRRRERLRRCERTGGGDEQTRQQPDAPQHHGPRPQNRCGRNECRTPGGCRAGGRLWHVGPFTLSTVGDHRMGLIGDRVEPGWRRRCPRDDGESVPRRGSSRPPAFGRGKQRSFTVKAGRPSGGVKGPSLAGREPTEWMAPPPAGQAGVTPPGAGGRSPLRPCRSHPRRHSSPCRQCARCAW